MELLMKWSIIVFVISTFATRAQGNLTPVPPEPKTPVYFPALPEAIPQNFRSSRFRDYDGVPQALFIQRDSQYFDLFISRQKHTTTTEKLPLAQESHVAKNFVTEEPGPSYLTDSVYYTPDPTSSPPREAESEERFNSIYNGAGTIFRGELRNISSFQPRFGKTRLTFDAFLNPALMHYIPMNTEDDEDTQFNKDNESFPPRDEVRAVPSTTYRPPILTTTTTEKIPILVFTDSPSFRRTTISSPRGSIRTTSPSLRIKYNKPVTRPLRIINREPQKAKRIELNLASRQYSNPIQYSSNANGFFQIPVINSLQPRIFPSFHPTSKPTYVKPTTPSSVSNINPLRQNIRNSHNNFRNFAQPLSFGQRVSQREQKKIEHFNTFKYSPTTDSPNKQAGFSNHFVLNNRAETLQHRKYSPPVIPKPQLAEVAPVYHTSSKTFRAPSSLFQGRSVSSNFVSPTSPDFIQTDPNIYIPNEYDKNSIPGIAGIDYPTYHTPPSTSFACSAQTHPGLYADMESQCQVFHICQEGGREDSFLCPNGTVFNQEYFVCDWWYNFVCERAAGFYSLNALIYEISETISDTFVYS